MKQPLPSHARHGVCGAGAWIMAILVLACAASFFLTFLSAWILLGSFLAVVLIEGLAAFAASHRKTTPESKTGDQPQPLPWHPS